MHVPLAQQSQDMADFLVAFGELWASASPQLDLVFLAFDSCEQHSAFAREVYAGLPLEGAAHLEELWSKAAHFFENLLISLDAILFSTRFQDLTAEVPAKQILLCVEGLLNASLLRWSSPQLPANCFGTIVTFSRATGSRVFSMNLVLSFFPNGIILETTKQQSRTFNLGTAFDMEFKEPFRSTSAFLLGCGFIEGLHQKIFPQFPLAKFDGSTKNGSFAMRRWQSHLQEQRKSSLKELCPNGL